MKPGIRPALLDAAYCLVAIEILVAVILVAVLA